MLPKMLPLAALALVLAAAPVHAQDVTLKCNWVPDPLHPRQMLWVCVSVTTTPISLDSAGKDGGPQLKVLKATFHMSRLSMKDLKWVRDARNPTKRLLESPPIGTLIIEVEAATHPDSTNIIGPDRTQE